MSISVTLVIADSVASELQREVYRTNADRSLNLNLTEWLELHLQEIAIAQDLTHATEQLRKAAEELANTTLVDNVNTERERLLDDL